MRTAVVLGGTGLIGRALVDELSTSGKYSAISLFLRRDPGDFPDDVEIIVTPLDELDKFQEKFAVDDVFCCLGTTMKQAGSQAAFRKVDYDYCFLAASLAKQAGAKHFLLVSAVNADARSPVFYSRVKGELERDIESLGLPRTSFFKPGLLTGERKEFRAGESAGEYMMGLVNPFLKGRFSRARSIPASHVAIAMCAHALAVEENLDAASSTAPERLFFQEMESYNC